MPCNTHARAHVPGVWAGLGGTTPSVGGNTLRKQAVSTRSVSGAPTMRGGTNPLVTMHFRNSAWDMQRGGARRTGRGSGRPRAPLPELWEVWEVVVVVAVVPGAGYPDVVSAPGPPLGPVVVVEVEPGRGEEGARGDVGAEGAGGDGDFWQNK